jgi:hypothetical protein
MKSTTAALIALVATILMLPTQTLAQPGDDHCAPLQRDHWTSECTPGQHSTFAPDIRFSETAASTAEHNHISPLQLTDGFFSLLRPELRPVSIDENAG